jgi:hypothetical protein
LSISLSSCSVPCQRIIIYNEGVTREINKDDQGTVLTFFFLSLERVSALLCVDVCVWDGVRETTQDPRRVERSRRFHVEALSKGRASLFSLANRRSRETGATNRRTSHHHTIHTGCVHTTSLCS